jgi:hypothetical protein
MLSKISKMEYGLCPEAGIAALAESHGNLAHAREVIAKFKTDAAKAVVDSSHDRPREEIPERGGVGKQTLPPAIVDDNVVDKAAAKHDPPAIVDESKPALENATKEPAIAATNSAVETAAKQSAKSAAGQTSKLEVAKHEFEAAEIEAVQERVRQAATNAALEAYYDAIAQGQHAKDANKVAASVALKVGRQAAKAEAVRAAEMRADNAIANGTAIDATTLGADGKNAMADYQAGKIGGAGRRLAVELEGKSTEEFRSIMEREVATGDAKHSVVKLDKPASQDMDLYEYGDGTVVRHKPLGDDKRIGPTYSLEIKKDASSSHNGPEGTAFKLDGNARAVPKGPNDVKNPYRQHTIQFDSYLRVLMDAGHRTFRSGK